jgi:hypothetical protein
MGARRISPDADFEVTVANLGTVSNGVDLKGRQLCGVSIPTGLEGTTLGFQVAADAVDGSYRTLMSGGVALSVTVAADRYVALDPNVFAGVRFVKLVVAAQTGAIVIELHTKAAT